MSGSKGVKARGNIFLQNNEKNELYTSVCFKFDKIKKFVQIKYDK